MKSDDTKPTLIEGYTYAAGDYPPEPHKPAILSAARLALDAFEAAPTASTIQDDAAYDAARALGPVLAHLDALTAGEVPDGEALGRMAWRARATPGGWGRWTDAEVAACMDESWETQSAEERARYRRIGTALHAIGYAAGRSEGEAERARLADDHEHVCRLVRTTERARDEAQELAEDRAGQIARLTAELAAAHDRALAHGVAVVASTERAMQAKIDAMAAELAEARASVVHADFAGGLSVCSRPGETTKDVARITCPACLVRLYSVANEDADQMRQEVERLLAERDTDLLDATEKERTACAAFLRSEGLEGAAAEMVGVRARAARRARGEGQGS